MDSFRFVDAVGVLNHVILRWLLADMHLANTAHGQDEQQGGSVRKIVSMVNSGSRLLMVSVLFREIYE